MTEHIDNLALFSSGGHVWSWLDNPRIVKELGCTGCVGSSRMVLSVGGRQCRIVGKAGGGALLIGVGSTRAYADGDLDAKEVAIQNLADSGKYCAWEDDSGGWVGSYMVVVEYRRLGPRQRGRSGAVYQTWQEYTCLLEDLAGGYE